MNAKQFRNMSQKDVFDYKMALARRDAFSAMSEINAYEKYLDKDVKVVKGIKVPIGTEGKVFWIGIRNYSPYRNWIYDQIIIGFKDANGNAYFTNKKNLELVKERSNNDTCNN